MPARIFITQPVASALAAAQGSERTVNPIQPRARQRKLIAGWALHLLFCLLHDQIDHAVIAANPKLRMIAAQSISPSNIDVAAANAKKIPVTVVPPITTEATADLNFGLMLAVARRMIEGDRMVRAGKFPGAQSRHLIGSFVHGRTIGLIGGGG
jgi:glyoxylate reductase